MYMTNKLFGLIKKYEFFILMFLILIMPLLIKLNEKVNFIYILLTSNYITLIINVCYFVIMYKKIQIINCLKYYIISRMGLKTARKSIHLFASICTLIFSLTLYNFLLSIYGCNNTNIFLIVLLIINTILYLIETNFIFLQFNRKSNVLFVVIPIIINFVYHYVFFIY